MAHEGPIRCGLDLPFLPSPHSKPWVVSFKFLKKKYIIYCPKTYTLVVPFLPGTFSTALLIKLAPHQSDFSSPARRRIVGHTVEAQ